MQERAISQNNRFTVLRGESNVIPIIIENKKGGRTYVSLTHTIFQNNKV